MSKDYEVGHVYERINESFGNVEVGDILIWTGRDSCDNGFLALTGSRKGERFGLTRENMKRIYPPEELSKDVTVTCEGHEVTISRESAISLGLCK